MTYFLSLMALPLLCVLWIVFQEWLAKQDPKYQGYQAGCGGCSRSCGTDTRRQAQNESPKKGGEAIQFIDASDFCSK